jgi:hypothetical protein
MIVRMVIIYILCRCAECWIMDLLLPIAKMGGGY